MGGLSSKLSNRSIGGKGQYLVLAGALAFSACASGRDDVRSQRKRGAEDKNIPATASNDTFASRRPSARENPMQVTFDWKAVRSGKSVQIDYKGRNPHDQKIYLAHKLVVADGKEQFSLTDQVIVIRYDEPGKDPNVIEVILGEGATNLDTYVPMHAPTYRPVAAKAEFSGMVRIPYPIRSWHPLDSTEPITDTVSKMKFRLQYFEGEPPRWVDLPSQSATIKIPDGIRPLFFEGATKDRPQ